MPYIFSAGDNQQFLDLIEKLDIGDNVNMAHADGSPHTVGEVKRAVKAGMFKIAYVKIGSYGDFRYIDFNGSGFFHKRKRSEFDLFTTKDRYIDSLLDKFDKKYKNVISYCNSDVIKHRGFRDALAQSYQIPVMRFN